MTRSAPGPSGAAAQLSEDAGTVRRPTPFVAAASRGRLAVRQSGARSDSGDYVWDYVPTEFF